MVDFYKVVQHSTIWTVEGEELVVVVVVVVVVVIYMLPYRMASTLNMCFLSS